MKLILFKFYFLLLLFFVWNKLFAKTYFFFKKIQNESDI